MALGIQIVATSSILYNEEIPTCRTTEFMINAKMHSNASLHLSLIQYQYTRFS